MPLSTNAPFSEFGQSMILRDIEQLYLALNAAGRGSSGDGATQDQAQNVDQESGEGGLEVDLTGLATTDYVNTAIQAAVAGIDDTTIPQNTQTFTSNGTFNVPAGVKYVLVFMCGAGGGGATSGSQLAGGGGGEGVIAAIDVSAISSITVTIGAGGTTVDGGDTSITATGISIVAKGGQAGYASSSSVLSGAGGIGGTKTGAMWHVSHPGAFGTMLAYVRNTADTGSISIGTYELVGPGAYGAPPGICPVVASTKYGSGTTSAGAAGRDGAVRFVW